ncbi:MAG: cupredoxin domain-containing protein [Thermomicrobiales bacterium]
MGSVQRMATVVIVGLVALSTVLFLYLGDEDNRIKAEAEEQQEIAIERGMTTFISLCLPCHGPAGEGYTEPGVSGTGRIGAALGGVNTSLNQEGINSQGTPVAGGVEGRETIIHDTIYNGLKNPDGTYRMPAFSDTLGGPLNDEQINELVLLIQHGDWNEVYNHAIETSGGYPTPPPGAAAEEPTEAAAEDTTASSGTGAIEVDMHDIYFDPTEITIPVDTPTEIHFVNKGAAVHDFTIDALGIHVTLNPGEEATETVTAPAGEYEYYCSIPGHKDAGMVGKMIASADAAPAAAPAEEESASTEEAPAEAGGAPAAAGGAAVEVDMHDIYFDPADISIAADSPTEIHLINQGPRFTTTIDALRHPRHAQSWRGSHRDDHCRCWREQDLLQRSSHKDAGMVGTLTVGGDAAPAAEPAEEESASTEESAAAAGDGAAAASAARSRSTCTISSASIRRRSLSQPTHRPSCISSIRARPSTTSRSMR